MKLNYEEKIILRDALHDFLVLRGYRFYGDHAFSDEGAAKEYVAKRYPELKGKAFDKKVSYVVDRFHKVQKLLTKI